MGIFGDLTQGLIISPWSYILLWLWWRQTALKFEGREWGSLPSFVRSTHVANFLAFSGTPSSSYCSILICKYFMIKLITFFWNQMTIRFMRLTGKRSLDGLIGILKKQTKQCMPDCECWPKNCFHLFINLQNYRGDRAVIKDYCGSERDVEVCCHLLILLM